MYGEIPKARIEKFPKPPPLKVFKKPRNVLFLIVDVIAVVSISGIVINVPTLNTNKIANVIAILLRIV
jgi:hypothetical protein